MICKLQMQCDSWKPIRSWLFLFVASDVAIDTLCFQLKLACVDAKQDGSEGFWVKLRQRTFCDDWALQHRDAVRCVWSTIVHALTHAHGSRLCMR